MRYSVIVILTLAVVALVTGAPKRNNGRRSKKERRATARQLNDLLSQPGMAMYRTAIPAYLLSGDPKPQASPRSLRDEALQYPATSSTASRGFRRSPVRQAPPNPPPVYPSQRSAPSWGSTAYRTNQASPYRSYPQRNSAWDSQNWRSADPGVQWSGRRKRSPLFPPRLPPPPPKPSAKQTAAVAAKLRSTARRPAKVGTLPQPSARTLRSRTSAESAKAKSAASRKTRTRSTTATRKAKAAARRKARARAQRARARQAASRSRSATATTGGRRRTTSRTRKPARRGGQRRSAGRRQPTSRRKAARTIRSKAASSKGDSSSSRMICVLEGKEGGQDASGHSTRQTGASAGLGGMAGGGGLAGGLGGASSGKGAGKPFSPASTLSPKPNDGKKMEKASLFSDSDMLSMLGKRSAFKLEDMDEETSVVAQALQASLKRMAKFAVYREERRRKRTKTTAKPSDGPRRRSERRKRQLGRSDLTKTTGSLSSGASSLTGGSTDEQLKKALNGTRFKIINKRVDKNGDTHYRLQLVFNGLPVLGAELEYSIYQEREVEISAFPDERVGKPRKSSNRKIKKTIPKGDQLLGNVNLNLEMKLDKEKISEMRGEMKEMRSGFQSKYMERRKQAKGDAKKFAFNEKRTVERLAILVDETDEESPVRVVVEAVMLGANDDRSGAERPKVLLDAKSGETIREFDSLTKGDKVGAGAGGNEKVGQRSYSTADDLGLRLIEDTSSGKCYYESEFVSTYKLGGEGANDELPFSVSCGTEVEEKVNGGFGSVNDAHLHIDATVQFLHNRYNTLPLGDDTVVEVLVMGAEEDNANWDGKSLNLQTGKDTFHPLVSADVAAHELGHGMIELNSALEYSGESGGLNEAFSDMLGKVAETYVAGTEDPADWKIGDEILKTGTALRYMDDPTKDGKSVDHLGDVDDETDVHYSSGVMNKAFALIAQKPSFTIWETFDMFAIANWYYWRSSTGFADGAAGALRGMCDLKEGKFLGYDYSHIDIDEAVEAFEEVGITCARSSGCKYQCQRLDKA